jgi:thioredoxin 1
MLVQRGMLRLLNISKGFATGKHVVEITSDAEFRTKLASIKTPVLVDFYADWCGPCKALMPRLLKQAEDDNGKWTLFKVNIDEDKNSKIVDEFKVSAVPTLVLIKNGKPVQTKLGMLSNEALKELLAL